jgi:O-glycosyl hydrolase
MHRAGQSIRQIHRSRAARRARRFWCLALLAAACGSAQMTEPGPEPGDTVSLVVNLDSPLQTIRGFGATTVPLVYSTGDYLGPFRPAAIEAAYRRVGLTLGSLSLGVVEAPAGSFDPFGQRQNDNDDPMVAAPGGFNFAGAATIRSAILLPAGAYGFASTEFGALLNLRGPLDWLRPIRTADYSRYLEEAGEHVLAIIRYWRDSYGVEPPLVHLFNEPTSGNVELVSSSTQEVVDLVKRVGLRLRAGGFPTTRFIVPNEETMSRSRAVAQAILADPVAREFVGAIGFHQYPYGSAYASPRRILETSGRGTPDPAARQELEQLRALGAQYGVPLWMTEVTEGPGTADFSFDAFEPVLARVIHIHDVLAYGGASAYFGMIALWDSRSHAEHFAGRNAPFLAEQSGMVLIELPGGQVRITPMGHAVGHYARWLGPAARLVGHTIEEAQVLASTFHDVSRQRIVVVGANLGTSARIVRIRITGAEPAGTVTGEWSNGFIRWEAITPRPVGADGAVEYSVRAGEVFSLAIPLR